MLHVKAHSVQGWRLKSGGRRSEYIGKVLSKDANLKVYSMCALTDSYVLYDEANEELMNMKLLDE